MSDSDWDALADSAGYEPSGSGSTPTSNGWLNNGLNSLGSLLPGVAGIIGAVKGPTKPATVKPISAQASISPVVLIIGAVVLVLGVVLLLRK